jgi:hypothetical protein
MAAVRGQTSVWPGFSCVSVSHPVHGCHPQSVRRATVVVFCEHTRDLTMKKLVPDPPVPYFLINAELSAEDALAQVDKLLDCLNGTIKANLFGEPIGIHKYLLEVIEVLNQLILALVAHARDKEAVS